MSVGRVILTKKIIMALEIYYMAVLSLLKWVVRNKLDNLTKGIHLERRWRGKCKWRTLACHLEGGLRPQRSSHGLG
jgi:hypothetical protein